jgi:hypothetical protein
VRATLINSSLGGVNLDVHIIESIQEDCANRTNRLISDTKIKINDNNEFNLNFGIFFTSYPLPQKYIIANSAIGVAIKRHSFVTLTSKWSFTLINSHFSSFGTNLLAKKRKYQ